MYGTSIVVHLDPVGRFECYGWWDGLWRILNILVFVLGEFRTEVDGLGGGLFLSNWVFVSSKIYSFIH
jgi:hypothetical protein